LHGAVFAYEGNVGDVAVLRPMMSPRIGVQLMEGPREISAHEILVCKPGVERHSGTVDGKPAVVSIFTLTCDKRKFAVQSVEFEQSLE
jgi:hypothetical protein